MRAAGQDSYRNPELRGINKEDPFFKMPGQRVRRMSENSNTVPDFNR
ncbi:MAG: hypothetical protein IJ205_09860 [Bacteroidales bacterium]|nr:hypothetical protein [Bacteroidales bacterium]